MKIYLINTTFQNIFSKIDSIPINKLDLSNQIIILNVNLSEGSISFLFERLYNNDDITQPKILNNQLYYLKGVSSKYEFTSLEIQKNFLLKFSQNQISQKIMYQFH